MKKDSNGRPYSDYLRVRCFKEADDDWYGNYKIEEDNRHKDKKYVELSLLTLTPMMSDWTDPVDLEFYPKGAQLTRVCVWGNDDTGIELDFRNEADAVALYKEVALWPILNRKRLCKEKGFRYA